MIAAHPPDGTRILDLVAQDLLQLIDRRRTGDHLRSRDDAAVVVRD